MLMVTALKGHLLADEFHNTFSCHEMYSLILTVVNGIRAELNLMKAQASEWAFYMGHSGNVLSRMKRIFIYKYSLSCLQ